MGFFKLFKKPTIVEDDYFGRLRYMDFKDPAKGYFEGNGFFSPTQSETEFLLDADITGPTSEQREFYAALQENFSQYIGKMQTLIEDEFRNWKDDFEIQDFNNEFRLVCITIPRLEKKPVRWEMSFSSIHDLNHHFTIDFLDNEPQGVLIDG